MVTRVERITMGQKTIRFSDLSEKLITDDGDLVRIVVREHPELDGQAVEFEGHRDEVQTLLGEALQVAEVELHFPGEDEPRRLVVDTAIFDKLATARPMAELLIAAGPAKRSASARSAAPRKERIDYGTLEHAGTPHRGAVTDAEKQLVGEHLEEINKRLAADGIRTIDPADPDHAERYGLEPAAGA
jgi:hypothetical protein